MKKGRVWLILPIAICSMLFCVALQLFGNEDINNMILAGLSIVVTVILGCVTYIQTKQQLYLDSIEKIPYLSITDIAEELASDTQWIKYDFAKYIIDENDHYMDRNYEEDRKRVFLIVRDGIEGSCAVSMKMRFKNISTSCISRIEIFTINNNILKRQEKKYIIENIFRNAKNKDMADPNIPLVEESYKRDHILDTNSIGDMIPGDSQTVWITRKLGCNDNFFVDDQLPSFSVTVVFRITTIYKSVYFQETDMKLYLDQMGNNGVHLYRVIGNETKTYLEKEYLKLERKRGR